MTTGNFHNVTAMALLAAFLISPIGCKTPARVLATGDSSTDGDTGSDSDTDNDTDTDVDDDSDSDFDECTENNKLIYALDYSKSLYRFDPPNQSFEPIGEIDCGLGEYSWPFSMAVARDSTAYVLLWKDDECSGIFEISTEDASCVGQTNFDCGTEGFELFGMAFSTEGENTTDEQLYLSSMRAQYQPSRLAAVDLSDWSLEVKGEIPSDPELTGTGNGEIWGYFPRHASSPDPITPKVIQVDKETGAELVTFELNGLPPGAYMWAFAFWGGDFYIFDNAGEIEPASTNVYKLSDGDLELLMDNTGLSIIGAGVSTCAPIEVE